MQHQAERNRDSDHLHGRDGIRLIPYAEVNGIRTLSNDDLAGVWAELEHDGIVGVVFRGGEVIGPDDFIGYMQRQGNYPVVILADERIAGVAWINSVSGNHAFAHFAFCRWTWGERTLEMGQAVLRYWFAFPGSLGRPLFDVIIGNIPSSNRLAVRYVQKLGFTVLGEIPRIAGGGPMTVTYIERNGYG